MKGTRTEKSQAARCPSKVRRLLTTLDLEREYGGSSRTWEKRRLTGDTPRFIKAGRSVFYDRADVELWLEKRKRRSTSDRGPEAP